MPCSEKTVKLNRSMLEIELQKKSERWVFCVKRPYSPKIEASNLYEGDFRRQNRQLERHLSLQPLGKCRFVKYEKMPLIWHPFSRHLGAKKRIISLFPKKDGTQEQHTFAKRREQTREKKKAKNFLSATNLSANLS